MWATVEDVTGRWIGDPIPATDEQISTLLADAEDLMIREFPGLADTIDTPDGPPLARVKRVAARVVIRHLRNPDGIRSLMEGAGPFQKSTTYGGDDPGALMLTEEDRRDLGGARGGGRAFQVDMCPEIAAPAPTVWAAL